MASRKDGVRRRHSRVIAREARRLIKAARALANVEATPLRRHLTIHLTEPIDALRPISGLVRPPGNVPALAPARGATLPVSPVTSPPAHVDAEHARAVAFARSLRTHSALERARGSLNRLRSQVPGSLGAIDQARPDPRIDRLLARRLGARGPEIVALARRLTPADIAQTFGVLLFDDMLERVERAAHEHLWRVVRPLQTARSGSGDGPGVGFDSNGYFVTAGDKTARVDGNTFWAVLLTLGVALLVGWIVENLEEWFNEKDDDFAREEIMKLSCDQIVALDQNNHWLVEFGKLIDGPTGDEDERAMIKVLGCLPSDRVKAIVNHFGLSDFLDEFQGAEFDAVTVVLTLKGMLKSSDWDDNATRMFINTVSTEVLAVSSVDSIVNMCRNMFDGDCGDEDENAILRLLKAQDLCKVKQVLQKISFDEFDDNVDGSEWTKLSALLNAAKHASCP